MVNGVDITGLLNSGYGGVERCVKRKWEVGRPEIGVLRPRLVRVSTFVALRMSGFFCQISISVPILSDN